MEQVFERIANSRSKGLSCRNGTRLRVGDGGGQSGYRGEGVRIERLVGPNTKGKAIQAKSPSQPTSAHGGTRPPPPGVGAATQATPTSPASQLLAGRNNIPV